MRSEHSLFKIGPFTNKNLNLAALASTALTAFVLFVPGVQGVFNLRYLTLEQYLIGLGLIFVPLVVMELAKALGFIKHRH
jgi:Ca2+-transporting ATPase